MKLFMIGTWPAPRLMKEARPLLWPWCIAVLASLAALGSEGESVENVRLLCLCGSVGLLAALPFGAEFQQRTLPLVLSQPIERSRIFREKLGVLGLAGGLVLLFDCHTWGWLEHWGFWDLAFVGLVVLATVTSSGLGILLTRSRVAGIALGVLGQSLVFGSFPFVVRKLYEHFPLQVATVLGEHKPELAVALSLYAFCFVWLGRRFWAARTRALGVTVAAIVVVLGVGRGLAGLASLASAHSGNAAFDFLFVVVTACSAGFWALTARSTVGGLVFCVSSQVLAALVLVFVLAKVGALFGAQPQDNGVTLGVGGLAYAGLFLWLGWRKFARMELRDAIFGEGMELPRAEARGVRWPGWLVCRPGSHLLNLFRKELRLQKPVFLTAAVFLGCWVVAWGLHQLSPLQGYQHFLTFLPFFYTPVVLLLAGCISLGDEKTLGVAAWQLTLPVAPRRLWMVKLVVANLSGLALGLGLPVLLLWLAACTDPQGQLRVGPHGDDLAGLFLGGWLVILLSFWAGTLVSNVVRAGLTMIAVVAAGVGCVALGIWAGNTLVTDGLQTGLLSWVLTHRHLSPNALTGGAMRFTQVAVLAVAAAWVFLLLRQSLEQFRRIEVRWRTLVMHVAVLAVTLVVCPIWVKDFLASARNSWSEPQAELEQALRRLPSSQRLDGNKYRVVSVEELAATGALSDSTQRWLTGARISHLIASVVMPRGRADASTWFVCIEFPDGGEYSFGMLPQHSAGTHR